MKKLLLLFCIFSITIGSLLAQTLKIDVAASTLFPASCDSNAKQPLQFEIIYQGATISGIENIGIRYKINGTTYKTFDSTSVSSISDGDSISLADTVTTSTNDGFNSGTEDIVVIWPTGSGGIAIVGDTIVDTTTVKATLGIASLNNATFYITLSPNPAQNLLYLNYNAGVIQLEQVRIYNVLGQPVLLKNSSFNSIDITALPDGFYFLEATVSDKNRYVTPFVKTR